MGQTREADEPRIAPANGFLYYNPNHNFMKFSGSDSNRLYSPEINTVRKRILQNTSNYGFGALGDASSSFFRYFLGSLLKSLRQDLQQN